MPANSEAALRKIELLRKIKYFSALDDATLHVLQQKMQPVHFKSGEVLFAEGDEADSLYIIETGEIAVLKKGDDEVTVQVAVLQSDEIAGTMSLFGGGRRSATLKALAETRAWSLDHVTFQKLLDKNASLARGLLSSLSGHLSRETSLLAKVMSHQMESHGIRVAFFDSKPYSEAAFRANNRYNYGFQFFEARLTKNTVSLAAGFKVVCTFVNDQLNAAVIEELHDLGVEMIALRCAGFNNVDLAACERLGITVARVPAYSPYAVAEHAVALMMSLNRRIHRSYNRVRESNFSLAGLEGFDMHGKTAGVIGAGKIGQCVIKILEGFGCDVLVHDKYCKPEAIEKPGVRLVELDELLASSDIITLHAPLTPETYHLVAEETIQKMKRGVMIINTSRGALIDAKALLAGLKSGQVGYAGLDVYEEEGDYFFEDLSDRVMPDDILARLTTFPNVILTSHQAFLTREALSNIASTTIESIREFETGKRTFDLTYSCAVK